MSATQSSLRADATAAGTIDLGGRYTVHRLGYGAMRITGAGIWGGTEGSGRGEARP